MIGSRTAGIPCGFDLQAFWYDGQQAASAVVSECDSAADDCAVTGGTALLRAS